MAKKKESIYKTWEEVDSSLKKLGELQINKSKLEGKMNTKMNEIKEEYTTKGNIIIKEIKGIEKEISRFCEQNKEAFVKKRKKELNFGSISYKLNKKVVCCNLPSAIKALKHLNLDFCLRIKEEIDKDKIKGLDSNTLTKIGVQIVKEDKLTIEPNIVEIAANFN